MPEYILKSDLEKLVSGCEDCDEKHHDSGLCDCWCHKIEDELAGLPTYTIPEPTNQELMDTYNRGFEAGKNTLIPEPDYSWNGFLYDDKDTGSIIKFIKNKKLGGQKVTIRIFKEKE